MTVEGQNVKITHKCLTIQYIKFMNTLFFCQIILPVTIEPSLCMQCPIGPILYIWTA